MDRIFDRLCNLLRIFTRDAANVEDIFGNQSNHKHPDLAKAWEELDNYLNSKHPTSDDPDLNHQEHRNKNRQEKSPVNEDLRGDYATLGVAFGSSISDVKRSYKRLMLSFHPDHFLQDSKQQDIATRTSVRINAAYSRIATSLRKS